MMDRVSYLCLLLRPVSLLRQNYLILPNVRVRYLSAAQRCQAAPNTSKTSRVSDREALRTIFGPSKLSGKAGITFPESLKNILPGADEPDRPIDVTYRLHVYATKHNTHLTLTDPARTPIVSLSTGNLGFRKGARGTYDAAYQLASYVLGKVGTDGLLNKIRDLEVVLRGFGIGREAVTRVILGTEGRLIREKVRKVTDATRLKFGGTRSPKPRRLG